MCLIPTDCEDEIMPEDNDALHETRLSRTLHDLSGPMLIAKGFTEELRLARESALALLASLPPETDPDIVQSLKDQIDTEMDHCLFRIDESLTRLDATIESLRAA